MTVFWIGLAIVTFIVIYDIIVMIYRERRQQKQMRESRKRMTEVIKQTKELIKHNLGEGESHLAHTKLEVIQNDKSLENLLHTKAEEQDYEELVDFIVDKIQDLYKDFKFVLMKPQGNDYLSGYAVRFIIDPAVPEDKDFLIALFKFTVDKGLEERKISNVFADKVESGDVLGLGNVYIDKPGTGISSVLTGEPLQVFISYETEEYRNKRLKVEEEKQELQDKQALEQEKQQDNLREAHRILTEASALLEELSEKLVEDNPEFIEAYTRVKDLFEGRG